MNGPLPSSYRKRGSSSFHCHVIPFVQCSKKISQLMLLGPGGSNLERGGSPHPRCAFGFSGIAHVHYHCCSPRASLQGGNVFTFSPGLGVTGCGSGGQLAAESLSLHPAPLPPQPPLPVQHEGPGEPLIPAPSSAPHCDQLEGAGEQAPGWRDGEAWAAHGHL